MICCDVSIGPCGRCHQDTLVHIDSEYRKVGQPGWGCLTCKTGRVEEINGETFYLSTWGEEKDE